MEKELNPQLTEIHLNNIKMFNPVVIIDYMWPVKAQKIKLDIPTGLNSFYLHCVICIKMLVLFVQLCCPNPSSFYKNDQHYFLFIEVSYNDPSPVSDIRIFGLFSFGKNQVKIQECLCALCTKTEQGQWHFYLVQVYGTLVAITTINIQ